MIFHGGYYYYSETRDRRHIFIRRSRTIAGIGQDPGVCVWSAPARGKNSDNVWAPELHLIDGKWFIYYAADDGDNDNHRMWVLESEGSNPCGRYECRGRLGTEGWAIDGTAMTLNDGRKYFLWSGWPGKRNGQQNIYIAPMSDAVTISGPRVLIAAPDQEWERVAMPICEGPQVLKRNGDIFVVVFRERQLDRGLLPGFAAQQHQGHAQPRGLGEARTGIQEDRSGLGRRPLLVREVALPKRGLDRLSFKIQPKTGLGRSRRACQALRLEE